MKKQAKASTAATNKKATRPSLKADCSQELNDALEEAVAALAFTGERVDRSKFIRDAVERRLAEPELQALIARLRTAAKR